EGVVFVCPGFLQPSKGFDRAVAAFADAVGSGAPASPPPRLYVVGSVRVSDPETEAYVERLAAACASVPGTTLVRGFVDDAEFDRWICAADVVVLPYRRSFSSGVLARAHALGR